MLQLLGIKLISYCIAGLVGVALAAGQMYLLLHTTSNSWGYCYRDEKKWGLE